MGQRKASYSEFWPFYLKEHSKPKTRMMHYVGTGLVIAFAIFALVTQSWWFLLAMPLAGYFFAWISHAFIERNRPATLIHPFWSLVSDFRMFFLWISGQLGPELDKAGVDR